MKGHKKLEDYWQSWAVLTLVSLLATIYYMPRLFLFGWLSFLAFCLSLLGLARRR